MFFYFFDEKPNAMLGIAPNNPTMSFKAPARCPQVVWRISMASISNRVYPKKPWRTARHVVSKKLSKDPPEHFVYYMYRMYSNGSPANAWYKMHAFHHAAAIWHRPPAPFLPPHPTTTPEQQFSRRLIGSAWSGCKLPAQREVYVKYQMWVDYKWANNFSLFIH